MRVNTFHFIGRALFASLFVAAIFNVVNAAAYTVTFNSTFGEFDDGSTTNIVEYNDDHTVKSGEYKEPTYNTGVDSSDFITWYSEYDAKNRVNLDEISSDTTVYAAYEKITWRWDYTGDEQSFSLPITAGLQLHVWGAQGGTIPGPLSINDGTATIDELSGGYGGYSTGLFDITKNQPIYINVGGQGGLNRGRNTISEGGYNGGGTGGINDAGHLTNARSTGGGGATHIATKTGVLSTLEDSIDSIAIVAGGGGGKYYFRNDTWFSGPNLGHGGGFKGGPAYRWGTHANGSKWLENIVQGGSQVSAGNNRGSFGQGANAPDSNYGEQGGGGGGFYGGGASTFSAAGGSGYIGNDVETTRHMAIYVDYSVPTATNTKPSSLVSEEDQTKTIITEDASENAIEDYAKLGNGYAKAELTRLNIRYVNEFDGTDFTKDQYVGSLAQEFEITQRPGYTAAWYKGDVVWNFDDPVNFDTTLEVKYTPIVYNISYELGIGTLSEPNPSTYTIESGDITLNNPTAPDYYTFLGWSGTDLDGNNNENVTIVSGSIGNREYTANFAPIKYSITYELNGGENSSRNPSSYNIESSIRLADASKEGYDFLGWAEGDTIAPGEHGDKTFTAQFEIKHYNVTVNYEGGEVFNDTIDHGSDFPTLNIPEVAPGYERKYYNNGNEYDITQPVTSDLDITVVDEIIRYTITYVMDGHTNSTNNPTSYTVEDADIVLEDAEPKAYYYYFLGWTTNPNTEEDMAKDYTIPTGSTGDIALYAIFQQNPYTIDFDCEDFCEFEPITKIGEEPIGELPTPQRDGYIFIGWFIDDNKLEPTSTPRSSATATARWEKIEVPNTSDSIITFVAIFTLSVFTLLFIAKTKTQSAK